MLYVSHLGERLLAWPPVSFLFENMCAKYCIASARVLCPCLSENTHELLDMLETENDKKAYLWAIGPCGHIMECTMHTTKYIRHTMSHHKHIDF